MMSASCRQKYETDIVMMDEEAAGVRRLGAGEQRRNFDVEEGAAVREEA